MAVYALTRGWPQDERYGLTSQLRRCAISAEANIAEGSAKRGSAEFARFLDIAHGSPSEAECLLEIARDLSYLAAAEWTSIERQRVTAARQTAGLLAAVRVRARRLRSPAALPP